MTPHLLIYKGTQTISLQIGVRQVLLTPGKHDLESAFVPKYLAHPRIQKLIADGELDIVPPKGESKIEKNEAEKVTAPEVVESSEAHPVEEPKSEEDKPGFLGKIGLGKKSKKKS